MLNLKNKNNTLDFGLQLQAPIGYNIDYAIATSYSLDLYALLTIPLALFYNQTLESEINEHNFQVLESLQNLPKHFKIYYHEGKISVPKNSGNKLLAFIENCVVGIKPKEHDISFHPKVWVLRYKSIDSKDIIYKLIIMSRNLTFDRSYDIAYWMEGKVQSSINSKNKDLVDLVKWLDIQDSIPHKKFIRDLAKVSFSTCDNFKDFKFHFFPKKDSKNAIQSNKIFKKRLIVSPFLSARMVKELSRNVKTKLQLFSRKEELDKINVVLKDNMIDAYYFNQKIIEGNSYEQMDEGNHEEDFQREWDNNIHAKLYINENTDRNFWHLGSSNCSNAAFSKNYEFIISLESEATLTHVSVIKGELLKEYNNINVFKEYEPTEDFDTIEKHDFRKIEFEIINMLSDSFQANLIQNEQKNYDLTLETNITGFSKEYSISFRPLNHNIYETVKEGLRTNVFKNITLANLSRFLEWRIIHKKSKVIQTLIVKIELANLPENRLESILGSIIENPNKFLFLIQALLSTQPIDNINTAISKLNAQNNTSNLTIKTQLLNIPIYEDLLLALSRDPFKVKRLKTLMERLLKLDNVNKLLTKEFIEFWNTIKQFLPNE